MDVKSYCKNMEVELIGWKAKIYDAMRQTEKMSVNAREMMNPMIQEMHRVMDDLSQRIDWLEKECPSQWGLEKEEIGTRMEDLQQKWTSLWEKMDEPLISDTVYG